MKLEYMHARHFCIMRWLVTNIIETEMTLYCSDLEIVWLRNSAIFFFWCMWMSRWVENFLRICILISTFTSTRSHPSEDRTRSKNCKRKLVFRTSYQNTCRSNAEYQSDTVGKVALILTHGWTLIDEARRELLVLICVALFSHTPVICLVHLK
jgi:hypothetical protein